MLLDYDRRVKRGIKFLDKRVGRDTWLPRFRNPLDIHVSSANFCPLAIATDSNYWVASKKYKIDGGRHTGWRRYRAIWLGFLREESDWSSKLDDEWIKQITELRERELVDW